MVHPDFGTFYRSIVLPNQAKNPGQKRLDGKQTGGSRDSAGQFLYQNKAWTVHMDSNFEPLRIAYDAFEQGIDPFRFQDTARGIALALVPDLKSKQSGRHKYLYIYSW